MTFRQHTFGILLRENTLFNIGDLIVLLVMVVLLYLGVRLAVASLKVFRSMGRFSGTAIQV